MRRWNCVTYRKVDAIFDNRKHLSNNPMFFSLKVITYTAENNLVIKMLSLVTK